jgi:hypothetical protein
MRTLRRAILSTVFLVGATAQVAKADDPNLFAYVSEGMFFATETSVTVNFLYSQAAQDNELYFFASVGGSSTLLLTIPGTDPLAPVIGDGSQTATFGTTVGDEVIFAICSGYSGDLCSNLLWYNGPASRNGGEAHVAILSAETWNGLPGIPANATAGYTVFGFEDRTLALSDLDYNDLVFEVTGVTTVVPEPATMGLVALGLVGMAAASARRRRQQK